MSNLRPTTSETGFRLAACFAIAASALVAIWSGLEPTGRPLIDAVWLALFGGTLGFAVLYTPRILLVVIGALAVVAESQVGVSVALAVAAIGFFGADRNGLTSRVRREDSYLALSLGVIASPLTVGALFHISDFWGTGSSAALAGALSVVIFAFALDRPLPRFVAPSILVALALAVSVMALTVHGAQRVQDTVRAAQNHGDAAAAAVRAGNLDEASRELQALESSAAAAVEALGAWELLPARFLPVASQNLAVIEDVASSGHEVARAARDVVFVAQSSDSLFADGAIAIDQVNSIVGMGDALRVDVEVLGRTLETERSPWMAPQLDTALNTAHAELAPLVEQAEGAAALSGLTNALLGADTPRQYLVLFANPSEARDLGGHTGSTAVIRVADGQIQLIDSRRNGILNQDSTSVSVVTADLPVRYMEQRPWEFAQNYTGTPDLPTISTALADVYPAITGHDIAGVIYVDPYALDALIALSGPVTLDTVGRTFESGDLASFLLRNQYAEYDPRGGREELFAELGTAAFDALANGNIEATPDELGRLAEVVRQGRLAFSPVDSAEREAMDALGVSGAITELRDDGDYLAVSHINSAPNKLDAYLHRTISYDVELDGSSLSATATVTLENEAPSGLHEFAAGNTNDLPLGTNRMTLVVHTPHELVGWEGPDAEPELTRSFREYDRWRHERIVIIPQGETRTVTIELAGTTPNGEYEVDIDAQPLVHADQFDVQLLSDGVLRSTEFVLHYDRTVSPS